jgi:hypothetical protein
VLQVLPLLMTSWCTSLHMSRHTHLHIEYAPPKPTALHTALHAALHIALHVIVHTCSTPPFISPFTPPFTPQGIFEWLVHVTGCEHTSSPQPPAHLGKAAAAHAARAVVACLRALPNFELLRVANHATQLGLPYPDAWLNSSYAPTRYPRRCANPSRTPLRCRCANRAGARMLMRER